MTMSTHCPGFNDLKSLKSFTCKCPDCGKEKEVFSDELNKPQKCSGCGKELDLSKCVSED
jgi:ribosomal protein S27E